MEVKFKNVDSIVIPEGCKAVIKDNVVIFEPIEQLFKRGDFLVSEGGSIHLIFENYEEDFFNSLFNKSVLGLNDGWNPTCFRLATPEEKAELIEFMRENGKDWSAEKCEVVDYRWRAKEGENYFIVSYNHTDILEEEGDSTDYELHSIGNYFKTKELAEAALEKRKELFLTLKNS